MTNNKLDNIIFCQAPADVPYVLDLYNKLKGQKISIYVINVVGIHQFLTILNLDINELIFIGYNKVNFKNPYSVLKEKIRIILLKKKYFQNKSNLNVYFFSRFEDWLTSSFIEYFANKKETIYYINHYDSSANTHAVLKDIKFTRKILGLIFNYLSGVKFIMNREFKFPEFPINKYNIIEQTPQLDRTIYFQFAQKFNFNVLNTNRKKILFFISPSENDIFNDVNYEKNVLEILYIINQIGHEIILKGHPRSGLPNFITSKMINKFDIRILESFIPGEFIEMSTFNLCIGIDSTILSILAKNSTIKTICLMNLFPPNNIHLYSFLRQYLINFSENKLAFINSVEEFQCYLKKI